MLAQALISKLSQNSEYKIFAASSKPIKPPACYVPLGEEELCFKENKIDCLIHCAFPRNAQADQWANGIAYGFRILFLAKQYDVNRVINISSQSLYGWNRTQPADENAPIILNSPYTSGKFSSEQLVERLFADRQHTSIRLASLIGPESSERVPNKLVADLLSRKSLNIQGGNQLFSFLHIDDAADALNTVITTPSDNWRACYNVGTEEAHTLTEIAELCVATGEQLGISGAKIITHKADIHLDNRLCCEAFFEDFGWRAKRTLADTISEIWRKSL